VLGGRQGGSIWAAEILRGPCQLSGARLAGAETGAAERYHLRPEPAEGDEIEPWLPPGVRYNGIWPRPNSGNQGIWPRPNNGNNGICLSARLWTRCWAALKRVAFIHESRR
jgi:hypothetical protein